jgi:hypothetical protein
LNDRIKNAITAHTIDSEEKGEPIITLRNFARWIFSSNSSSPVKLELSDRRFVCFDSCNGHANDREYFKPLYDWMAKDVHVAAFFRHLTQVDITDFDWVKERPKTALWEELRAINQRPPDCEVAGRAGRIGSS